MQSSRRLRALMIAVLTLVSFAGRAGAAIAQDLRVTFPQGWVVTRLPVSSADGQTLAGGTSRAILSSQAGRALAAIEFTREPQPAGSTPDLGQAAVQIEAGAGDVFGKAGLEFSCLTGQPIRVTGADGLDMQCAATRDGQTLVRQRIVLWSKAGMLASLSYTSSAAEFAAHLDAFNHTLASVAAD